MDTPPIRDSYLHAVYAFAHGGHTTEFSFDRASLPGAQPIALDLPGPWAIITAHNPMSRPLPAEENARRDESLRIIIASLGLTATAAENRAPDGDWREPSHLLLGIARPQALNLARRFDQGSLVWSEHTKVGLLDPRTETWTIRPIIGWHETRP